MVGPIRFRAAIAATCGALLAAFVTPVPTASAASYQVATTTFVQINDSTDTAIGTTPYPLQASALGMGGQITDVDVELPDLYHARPADLDLLVVAPSGTAVILKASSWCEHDIDYDRAHVDWRFSDQASDTMNGGSCPSGWYRPSVDDWVATHYSLGAPAPQVPYANHLSAFNGQNPNGTWRVYAYDNARTAQGELAQGFRIWITTAPVAAVIGDGQGSGPASPYPLTRQVSALDGTIASVDVHLFGLTHTYPDDLDVVLVGPNGRAVMLMSDACGGTDLDNVNLRVASGSFPAMPDDSACATDTTYSPTDWQPGESLSAPAPPAPYRTSLATFAGTNPNGTWSLYINDDFDGDSGYLPEWALQLRLRIETILTRHPEATTTSRSAVFAFHSDKAGATFQCRLDAEIWHPCVSPLVYRGLAVRQHSFRVRAKSSRGDTDTSPAAWTWRITS